jgi:hypothetical protein
MMQNKRKDDKDEIVSFHHFLRQRFCRIDDNYYYPYI